MADYKEFLDSINREAYHAGEYQWEEDGYTVTRTYHYSPPGCHSSCGLLYYVKDNKVEFVEGDPLDPCANGRLCMRCLNRVEAINHPDRLKYPMKRAGERGENKWERITWDEAYDIVERETRKVWEEYGPESILCTKGTARGTVWQLHYFFQAAFRTANVAHIGFTGYACYLPRTCGTIAPMGDFPIVDASQGHPDRYIAEEFRPPEVLVVWGNEPLASNADGYIGHWLVQCVQMGSKIISIDPRLTWWGSHAEYWLPVRPGTDAALACAWLNIIINEDLYDHEFVEKWCSGFNVIKEHVQEWTAERAAEICGLPLEDIIGSARLFASGNSSAIQWGLAFDQNMSAMALNLAAVDLMAICGNIDTPGGWLLVHNAFNVSRGSDNGVKWVDPEAAKKKATMHYVFNTDGEDFIHQAASEAVLHCMETGEPYPIKMWYAQSTNELACAAMDAPRLYKALKDVPFIAYADPFLTPTAGALADVVMPVAMSCERDSARSWWTPVRSLSKVTQYYEAKSDEEIIVELGRRLNPDAFPWETAEDFVNWFLTPAAGLASFGTKASANNQLDQERWMGEEFPYAGNLRALQKAGGHAYDKFNATYYKYEKGMLRPDGKPGFSTPSGRLELSPFTFKVWGLTPWPFFKEPPTGPVTSPGMMKEYPLILTCGGRSFEFFHSEDRQEQTMREFHRWPLLTIHPNDAEKYGITDGQWTWVESDRGRFRQVAYVCEKVKEGVVHAEHAWWYPEQRPEAPYFFGTFDSNVNNLTRAYEAGEGGVGSAIKCGICKIYPYKDGDEMPYQVVAERDSWNEIVPGSDPYEVY